MSPIKTAEENKIIINMVTKKNKKNDDENSNKHDNKNDDKNDKTIRANKKSEGDELDKQNILSSHSELSIVF